LTLAGRFMRRKLPLLRISNATLATNPKGGTPNLRHTSALERWLAPRLPDQGGTAPLHHAFEPDDARLCAL
jgi:hypothetical protein